MAFCHCPGCCGGLGAAAFGSGASDSTDASADGALLFTAIAAADEDEDDEEFSPIAVETVLNKSAPECRSESTLALSENRPEKDTLFFCGDAFGKAAAAAAALEDDDDDADDEAMSTSESALPLLLPLPPRLLAFCALPRDLDGCFSLSLTSPI